MSRKGNFLLALIIEFFIIACATQHLLTIEQIENRIYNIPVLILHSNSQTYLFSNYAVKDNILVGNIGPYVRQDEPTIHVYTKTNIITSANYRIDNNLSLPIEDIDKIVFKEYSEEGTEILIYFLIDIIFPLILFALGGEMYF